MLGDKKKIASLIVGVGKSPEEKKESIGIDDEMPIEDGSFEEHELDTKKDYAPALEDAAGNFAASIQSGDTKEIVKCFKIMKDLCDDEIYDDEEAPIDFMD